MFWKKDANALPRPKEIPSLVGSFLVTEEKGNPDYVWKLKGVLHPTDKKKVFYYRVFDEGKATAAGIRVKDWTSLDDHPDLIIWEGYIDKDTNTARREKFVKPSHS
ncbi:MAG: hypothetical protein V1849_05600 [Chloroflexota bacterium]